MGRIDRRSSAEVSGFVSRYAFGRLYGSSTGFLLQDETRQMLAGLGTIFDFDLEFEMEQLLYRDMGCDTVD